MVDKRRPRIRRCRHRSRKSPSLPPAVSGRCHGPDGGRSAYASVVSACIGYRLDVPRVGYRPMDSIDGLKGGRNLPFVVTYPSAAGPGVLADPSRWRVRGGYAADLPAGTPSPLRPCPPSLTPSGAEHSPATKQWSTRPVTTRRSSRRQRTRHPTAVGPAKTRHAHFRRGLRSAMAPESTVANPHQAA